jgi:hypothetical protein
MATAARLSRLRQRIQRIELLESRRMLAAPQFLDGQIVGTVESAALVEASGMVASRQRPGVLWTHNDNGDERLFAMNTSGRHLGVYTLGTITAKDWEDVAIGPGPQPGIHYVYIADTGDNSQVRSTVTVFRVAEPAVSPTQSPVNVSITAIDAINLRYPDGAHDAETLIVDPANGDIYIVTKRDSLGRIYYSPAPHSTAGVTTLQFLGQTTWTGAVSGDISPDGDELLMLGASRAYYYPRLAGISIADALRAAPEQVPYTRQQLGEGITFDPSGQHYYTNSEGVNQPLWYYERSNPAATLVAAGSTWRYRADGSDQGTAWRDPGFNDAAWSSGPAQLGYGDGDGATVVPGGSSSTKPITTYFRHTFNVANPAAFSALTMQLQRDDGAVVYLNGVEVARSNMPAGGVSYQTRASTAVGGGDESRWFFFNIDRSLLRAGANVIAVELHQSGPTSSDISFDLKLEAQTGAASPQQTVIAAGSIWRFLANGTDQGTSWRQPGFGDAAWTAGAAELGYGDGDERTLVDGGVSGSRPITTYLRHNITIADASQVTGLALNLRRDDGAVVYLNGVEVARSNMPAGAISYTTPALTNVGGADESRWFTFSVIPSLLQSGANVVAVEIHQSSATSSDISFDLQLTATLAGGGQALVVAGETGYHEVFNPYLNESPNTGPLRIPLNSVLAMDPIRRAVREALAAMPPPPPDPPPADPPPNSPSPAAHDGYFEDLAIAASSAPPREDLFPPPAM